MSLKATRSILSGTIAFKTWKKCLICGIALRPSEKECPRCRKA